jgi:hypothetical protein
MTPAGSPSTHDRLKASPPVVGDWSWTATRAGKILSSSRLANVAVHAITSRDFDFRGPEADDHRARLAATLGVSPDALITVRQVHGRAVHVIRPGDAPHPAVAEADAVVSTDPGRAVGVFVADCVPILLADRRRRVVAAVHAGWRGTCAAVVAATVDVIGDLGVDPGDLVAAVGPSIGPCCYQVDAKVRTAFLGMTPDAVAWFTEDGLERWKLDLWQASVDQLILAGVSSSAIDGCGVCTADHPDVCYSYRRDGAGTGRMLAAIRLTP